MTYTPGPGDEGYCPKSSLLPPKLVARATIAAAKALVETGGQTDYGRVRSEVVRGFANEFARAYGMRAVDISEWLERCAYNAAARDAFVKALQSLEYSTLTPEHFGHVHEQLCAWKIGDGKLVSSSERRGGGVHFTPRELTEPIVRHTLEPLVYEGPAEGKPREAWVLKSAKAILDLSVCDPAMGAGAFLLEAVRQLAQWVIAAGGETNLLIAKRVVTVCCIYGVDISPWAVAAAKIALWLECRAEDMPNEWLDDHLKCGDALLGVTSVDQLARFHLSPDGKTKKGEPIPEIPGLRRHIENGLALVMQLRRERKAFLVSAARGDMTGAAAAAPLFERGPYSLQWRDKKPADRQVTR
ncbi:MAG: DNA methyltransferase [Mycobacteriales bacterium]